MIWREGKNFFYFVCEKKRGRAEGGKEKRGKRGCKRGKRGGFSSNEKSYLLRVVVYLFCFLLEFLPFSIFFFILEDDVNPHPPFSVINFSLYILLFLYFVYEISQLFHFMFFFLYLPDLFFCDCSLVLTVTFSIIIF